MLNVCFLTNESINAEFNGANYNYTLTFGERTVQIFVCHSCLSSMEQIPKDHHSIVKGLIANGRWPERTFIVREECTKKESVKNAQIITLPDPLINFNYPKSASEKLNNLLQHIYSLQEEDGQYNLISCQKNSFYLKNYFKSSKECHFYLESLLNDGLIEMYPDSEFSHNSTKIRISQKGLSRITHLQEAENPKSCFIAMAFDDKTVFAREAIRRAVKKAGFEAVIIDEAHLASSQTIPDAILSNIKKCRFCVADFSLHRNGVYFESGFALGLGKPVIYLCQKAEFENSHFDIKQLQHIIYDDAKTLENLLFDKIEAWIK